MCDLDLNLTSGPDGSLKFNKMSDEDKKRFIAAVTGSGGKIDSKASDFEMKI